jgi:hypothetical protein
MEPKVQGTNVFTLRLGSRARIVSEAKSFTHFSEVFRLELKMPETDGLDVLRWISTDPI